MKPLGRLLVVLGSMLAKADEEMDFFDKILSEELPEIESSGKELEGSAERDFREFDSNKDGQIDALEIVAELGAKVNAVDLFYFFSNADKDSSGTVSFPEYVGYVKFTSGEAPAQAA